MGRLLLLVLAVLSPATASLLFGRGTTAQPSCKLADVEQMKVEVSGNKRCCSRNNAALKGLRNSVTALKSASEKHAEMLEASGTEHTKKLDKLEQSLGQYKTQVVGEFDEAVQDIMRENELGKLRNQVKTKENENQKLTDQVEELKKAVEEGDKKNFDWKAASKIMRPADCQTILEISPGHVDSGVYTIYPGAQGKRSGLKVYCDMEEPHAGSTVILHRFDGTVNFDQNWNVMKYLVGQLGGEHWLGLENVHRITNSGQYSLVVDMTSHYHHVSAVYGSFRVASEANKYKLYESGYDSSKSGTVADAFAHVNGHPFTTKDRINILSYNKNCGRNHQAPGWWYNCGHANMFGPYKYNSYSEQTNVYQSMTWYYFKNNWTVLKSITMKLRRRKF